MYKVSSSSSKFKRKLPDDDDDQDDYRGKKYYPEYKYEDEDSTAAETARPPSASAVTGASGNLPRHGAGVAMTPMGTTATDPELEARFQQSLTLGGSRPGTAGSRPGTAGSRPCWLE